MLMKSLLSSIAPRVRGFLSCCIVPTHGWECCVYDLQQSESYEY